MRLYDERKIILISPFFCREGGGNNIYNSDLSYFLSTMTKQELKKYILMEKIR